MCIFEHIISNNSEFFAQRFGIRAQSNHQIFRQIHLESLIFF
ncbi:Uncharacterised protein [Vibrio cholerae]|nr:Uncharacterised protein [Vibrio cholerae]